MAIYSDANNMMSGKHGLITGKHFLIGTYDE